jgi:hypothetical protein
MGMKKLFAFLLFIAWEQTSFATIWLVDNNPNSPTQYNSIQVVIDNHAANGDTIMVAGSPNGYGDIFITKPLTILGEGYNNPPGENTSVQQIFIRSSNVVVTGFNVTIRINFEAFNAPGNQLVNVVVERCYCNVSYLFAGGPLNSPYIMRNIRIRNTISQFTIFVSQNTNHDWILFDSLILENNIFHEPNFANWGSNITGANTIIVRNNLFFNGDNGGNTNTLFFYRYNSTNFHDAILYNNIFYDCNPTGSSNCTFMNNLTYGNGNGVGNNPFGTGTNDTLPGPVNNNIYSKNALFVNYAPGQPFSYNLDFHTSPGSPCIGAGVGGTDIGIYGGYYPFKVGDGPRIPVVDFINISNTAVPNGSTFYLQFDARVRQ